MGTPWWPLSITRPTTQSRLPFFIELSPPGQTETNASQNKVLSSPWFRAWLQERLWQGPAPSLAFTLFFFFFFLYFFFTFSQISKLCEIAATTDGKGVGKGAAD